MSGCTRAGGFADRWELDDNLSVRIPRGGERATLHDRGEVTVRVMLIPAGADARTDIEHLRGQERVFDAAPLDWLNTVARRLAGRVAAGGVIWARAS